MARPMRAELAETVRDAVPFLVIVALWAVVSLGLYGVFLVTKPGNVDYDAWVHASVFGVSMIGFLGHTLRQAVKGRSG